MTPPRPPAQAAPRRPGRAGAPPRATALLAGLALALTGCTYTNEQTTTRPYVPGDGQDVTLGVDVVVSSLMVVAEEEGGPGRLVARVVNSSPEERTVTFAGDGVDESVTAAPNETAVVGEPGDDEAVDVVIEAVAAGPGRNLPMTLTLDGLDVTEQVGVPVLDGALEQYAPYLPAAEPGASGPTPGGGGTAPADEGADALAPNSSATATPGSSETSGSEAEPAG